MLVPNDRIQAQLRASAATTHEVEVVPPFTCYLNMDDDAPWANYAMPDLPFSGVHANGLTELVECFQGYGRTPRVEYVADVAPSLASTLEAHGFIREDRTVLMVCTRESRLVAAPVDQLTIVEVTDDSPLDVMQDFMTVQGRAFAGDDRPAATRHEAQQFRQRFHTIHTFLARLGEVPVGAGSLTAAYDGIAEIAGIATISAFRRRGIAAAVTAHICQQAFDDDVEALFLTAANEGAGRVYERVGFQGQGSTLICVKEMHRQD